jgi:hypothetical protein
MSEPWKMLVYIAADNSLYEDAQISLRQITQSSLSANVEILVQFDGPTDTLASRYRCSAGRKTLYWQAPKDYTNDRRKRLKDFLCDSIRSSERKKRIFLVLWGHGAGLDHVYVYKTAEQGPIGAPSAVNTADNGESRAQDVPPQQPLPAPNAAAARGLVFQAFDALNSNNANRYVKDIDLGRVLLEFKEENGTKIDILGLDACLMGMAEICHELRESTSLMVASDEDLPKGSWPYDLILSDLTRFPGMDSGTLSTVVISRFLERYMEAGSQTRISLSSYNLGACDRFAVQFKRLVDAITADLATDGTMSKVIRARDFSRTADEPVYIDVAVFCSELVESFPADSAIRQEAAGVLETVVCAPYIIYHRDFGEDGAIDCYGLALYFPPSLAPEEVNANQLQAQPIDPALMPAPAPFVLGKKTPPNDRKNVITVGGTPMAITSYRILWKNYVALDFNKKTGWSDLVERFLPRAPCQAARAGGVGQPPNVENPDQ